MQERDINGLTPFQCAIQYRAYTSATLLWNEISESITNPTSLSEYVMPTGTKPDDSPLFTLCYNDTCSYTWTGDDHVKIDIFECRTCGLLDKVVLQLLIIVPSLFIFSSCVVVLNARIHAIVIMIAPSKRLHLQHTVLIKLRTI
jgi:hypothetical protein